MKVAVTGATGFIGGHVLEELAKTGVEVVPVSRSAARLPGGVAMDIASPPPNPYDAMGRPDALIHLAWNGLPNYRSLHHFESELPRQFAFLRALVEGGLPALVATGTCFEYGMQDGLLREEFATQPDNPYGFAKDALRRELQFLQRVNPFALTWARLFYMFGEGQAANSLYSQLKAAVDRGDTVFRMSGGQQLRDFLPVGEVARHLVALALSGGDHQVVNIASSRPITVLALVHQWLDVNGWTITLDPGHYPYPDYEPMAFWGANDRLLAAVGETSVSSS